MGAATSKINWLAAAMLAIGVLVSRGVIKPEDQAFYIEAATIFIPTAVIICRTFFTGRGKGLVERARWLIKGPEA